MIVRALDSVHDWQFGKGRNDYRKDIAAVVQSINTRLESFLGDCFFATNVGIDWFNLLGAKNEPALKLAISTTILNTPNVGELTELSSNLSENRNLTVSYKVKTTFGDASGLTTIPVIV